MRGGAQEWRLSETSFRRTAFNTGNGAEAETDPRRNLPTHTFSAAVSHRPADAFDGPLWSFLRQF